MSHRTLFVAQLGPPAFPRFAIYDAAGHAWGGSSWDGRPLLYSDRSHVSNDCFDLQRREAAAKPNHVIVEVPLRFETFSDQSLDLELLRDWLVRNVGVTVDVASDSGPTTDSIVIGSIEWPRFSQPGEAT